MEWNGFQWRQQSGGGTYTSAKQNAAKDVHCPSLNTVVTHQLTYKETRIRKLENFFRTAEEDGLVRHTRRPRISILLDTPATRYTIPPHKGAAYTVSSTKRWRLRDDVGVSSLST